MEKVRYYFLEWSAAGMANALNPKYMRDVTVFGVLAGLFFLPIVSCAWLIARALEVSIYKP